MLIPKFSKEIQFLKEKKKDDNDEWLESMLSSYRACCLIMRSWFIPSIHVKARYRITFL